MVSAARICTRSERSEARRFTLRTFRAMAFSDESFGIDLALEFIIFRLAHKGLYIQEMSDNVLFYLELNFILNLRLAYEI